MKFLTIIALLLIIGNGLQAQKMTNHGSTVRTEGHGFIDDAQKIWIILDAIERLDYKDHRVSSYVQFSGALKEENQLSNFTLSGNGNYGSDSLHLFLINDQFDRVGLFRGVKNDSVYTGVFDDLVRRESSPFEVVWDQKKFTQLNVETQFGPRTLPVNWYKYNQNEFELVRISEEGEATYVLIKLALTCCSSLRSRGQCCGGYNEFLRLYEIKKAGVSFTETPIEDIGSYTLKLDEAIDENIYSIKVMSTKDYTQVYRIEVDMNQMALGIQTYKEESVKD